MQTAGSKFSNFFRGRGSEPSKGYGMGGISENQSGFCSPAGSSFTFPDRMTVRYVTLSNRSIDSPDDTPTEDLVPVHTTDRSDRTQSSEIVKDGDHEQESLSSKLRNGLNLFSNKTLLPLQQLTDASCRIVVDNAPWMTSSPPRETDSSANRRASNSSLCSLGAGDSAGDSSSSRRASLLSPLSNLSLGWPASGPSNCVPDVAGRTISGSVVQQEVVIGKEDQFWVPVSVTPQKKRAQSLIPPTLTFTSDSNVEGSSVTGIANESSPHPASHVAAAAAAIGQRSPLYSPSAEGFDVLASGLLDPGDVDGPMQARRRRASMHEALDHRKIDASLYERPPSLVSSKQTIGHNVREENLGCIGFSMKYSPDQSLLTVRLLAARDLTLSHDTSRDASDMTPSSAINPFIRVCLLPDQRNGFQSTIQRNTNNPRFDEEFLFEMIQSVPWNRSLHFQIFNADNKDSTSGARLIGHVIVPLENSELTKQGTIWKGISQDPENKKLEPYVGDLMFAISYLPSAERLSVSIIKARNLKPHDPTGKSSTNPFVRVSLMNGSKKTKRKRTSSKKNSLNPEWNEALTFGLTREQLNGSHGKLTLELFVHSDNLLGSDVGIGKIVIGDVDGGTTILADEVSSWNDLLTGKTVPPKWYQLTTEQNL